MPIRQTKRPDSRTPSRDPWVWLRDITDPPVSDLNKNGATIKKKTKQRKEQGQRFIWRGCGRISELGLVLVMGRTGT